MENIEFNKKSEIQQNISDLDFEFVYNSSLGNKITRLKEIINNDNFLKNLNQFFKVIGEKRNKKELGIYLKFLPKNIIIKSLDEIYIKKDKLPGGLFKKFKIFLKENQDDINCQKISLILKKMNKNKGVKKSRRRKVNNSMNKLIKDFEKLDINKKVN